MFGPEASGLSNMDLSFSNYESPTKDIETKISELDFYSDGFLDYLKDSHATFTLDDILDFGSTIAVLCIIYYLLKIL